MPPEFSFRLNGTVVPMLFIQKERVNGELTGKKRLKAVWIDGVGRFAIDDDEHPWEFTFPPHVLEYRNETVWDNTTPHVRQTIKNDGWRRVQPDELIKVLEEAGVISCR